MNTETVLDHQKDESNYFNDFNFSKFKKILLPLAFIALLFIIKQFITNHFNTSKLGGPGLLGMFEPFTELPFWVKTVNLLFDILITFTILCWEAIYLKKYDKIKFIVLLALPSIGIDTVIAYSDLYESVLKSPFFLPFIILSYFHCYVLYGALRGKILFGEKINFMGFLIGMIGLVSINQLYQKVGSVVFLSSDFLAPLYSYGMILTRVFVPLSFFYFLFLADAGLSFKNFKRMPSAILLTKKKFTIHFIFLFTSLLSVYIYSTEYFSPSSFEFMPSSAQSIIGNLYNLFRTITQITFAYLLFSQLLLLQLTALRRRPLWIYLLSFAPVINLFTLLFYFRKRTPLTDSEFLEIEDIEQQNRSYLQIFILLLSSAYAIKRFIELGLSRENLIYVIAIFAALYILILYVRIGIRIVLALLGFIALFTLYLDLPNGLYYTCLITYAAIGLYNLHIALFWTAEEWNEIEENSIT